MLCAVEDKVNCEVTSKLANVLVNLDISLFSKNCVNMAKFPQFFIIVIKVVSIN